MPHGEEFKVRLHRLLVPVVFPAGVAPGSGKGDSNLLGVERRGTSFVLRGTAIVGVLRGAFAAATGVGTDHRDVTRWFGHALGEEGDHHRDRPSLLRVSDAVLDGGQGALGVRNHNSIERHTGAVRDGGLFSIEALPPGTSTDLVLTLRCEDPSDDDEAVAFLQKILGALENGLFLGGNSARGIGLARIDETRSEPMLRSFDLGSLDDHAAWLDESWGGRNGKVLSRGNPLKGSVSDSTLKVELELAIPRGQDLCVGDDTSLDFQLEPQRVTHADGKAYWRIPGSSLRGVFRAWVTRLAARAAKKSECNSPLDDAQCFISRGQKPADGDTVAWGFMDREKRIDVQNQLLDDPTRLDQLVPCPVMQLFGSLFGAGRVHVSDFLSTEPVSEQRLQGRAHVAVDRISGGANEGFLFNHQALLAGVRFKGTLVVRKPSEHEARWLADTLRAVDLGVLRIGSSKSSGRLALAAVPTATGQCAELFSAIAPSEVPS